MFLLLQALQNLSMILFIHLFIEQLLRSWRNQTNIHAHVLLFITSKEMVNVILLSHLYLSDLEFGKEDLSHHTRNVLSLY